MNLFPWLHSDIKNMAYYYVYPAFTNIVETGWLIDGPNPEGPLQPPKETAISCCETMITPVN